VARRSLSALLLLAAWAAAQPRTVTITVLATTDLHGQILPLDYATNRPAARGLAAISTLARQVRAENANTLLIDCGDTIQGSPLETVYQAGRRTLGDPMMRVMNLLGYAAMTVGNHEYTVGSAAMEQARRDARFPWLAANTTGFDAAVVKSVAGLRVAIIGVTTPMVPVFEPPDHLGGHRFSDPVSAVRRAVAGAHADLVVVAAHTGLGRDGEDPAEHVVAALAEQVPGIDAIVFGHSHKELAAQSIGKVLVIQPKNGGASLARLDFTFEGKQLRAKKGILIPVTAATPAAPDVVELARPYEEAAQRYLDTPVAMADRDLSGDAITDLINRVQLQASKADVSLATLFDPDARIAKGPVTLRQITAIYPYENDLVVVEGTAAMLKGLPDRIAGVSVNSPDQPLRIALNSYRATQPPFRNARIVWKSKQSIRDMLAATPRLY
jgi:2',3'-cyclic-nucleotide 2'-phosphodiesterase/3'-nucleotidase